MIFLKRVFECFTVFLIGGTLYCIIEIFWRGATHWSMGIAGGGSFCAIYLLRKHCDEVALWLRCITGAVIICTVELAAGFVLNIVLGWSIWDYSGRWLNIYGQICPLYAALWFFICIPGNWLSEKLERYFFGAGSL